MSRPCAHLNPPRAIASRDAEIAALRAAGSDLSATLSKCRDLLEEWITNCNLTKGMEPDESDVLAVAEARRVINRWDAVTGGRS
jgi:hypothetical protein